VKAFAWVLLICSLYELQDIGSNASGIRGPRRRWESGFSVYLSATLRSVWVQRPGAVYYIVAEKALLCVMTI